MAELSGHAGEDMIERNWCDCHDDEKQDNEAGREEEGRMEE